ncbi:MAG: hypothetical protein GX306_06590 [Clostridiales bacterium]|nr:hypothetical protein [Clostridiales bacterium]
MKSFHPDKLYVEFRDGVTETQPLNNRKYTLTHSDITAELFLTIGLNYAYDKISDLRDEVLAEWRIDKDYSFLYVIVYINGQANQEISSIRNTIFRRELPLALQAIRYGDRIFFDAYPGLDYAPIWIHFQSQNPDYDQIENWGTFAEYKISME